ncbi:MAG TPA: hypothetical protein VE687_06195, partial [Stellaceae bacterium]|nr:hypothetical protein [Stellaceae bacterium]
TGAVLLAMAISAVAGMLPLAADAQTSSAPQPLTPQTAPAYPYQPPPAGQGAYPYSYSYPYYYPYPYWTYGYPWSWGYPWGWGWPAAVSVGFGGCFNCGFRGAFFRPGFGRFGFGHRGFSTPGSDTLALPKPALVTGPTVAAADNLT